MYLRKSEMYIVFRDYQQKTFFFWESVKISKTTQKCDFVGIWISKVKQKIDPLTSEILCFRLNWKLSYILLHTFWVTKCDNFPVTQLQFQKLVYKKI